MYVLVSWKMTWRYTLKTLFLLRFSLSISPVHFKIIFEVLFEYLVMMTSSPHRSNWCNDHQSNISNSVCMPLCFPMFRIFLIKDLELPQYTAHHRAISALPASSPRHALSNGFDANSPFPSLWSIETTHFWKLSRFWKLFRRAVNSFCERVG